MKSWQQGIVGFIMAVLFSGLVLGSFSLSLLESGYRPPGLKPTSLPPFPSAINPSPGAPIAAQTQIPTATFTSSTSCSFPPGWVPYQVQWGETIGSIAARHGISPQELMSGNCMEVEVVQPGWVLHVPPGTPAAFWTSTPHGQYTPCSMPPWGWVPYTVRPGDTLSSIAYAFRVSVYQLQQANCLGASYQIYAGQVIYVPNVATQGPYPTYPPLPTPTPGTYTTPPTVPVTPYPTIPGVTTTPSWPSPTPPLPPTPTPTLPQSWPTSTLPAITPTYVPYYTPTMIWPTPTNPAPPPTVVPTIIPSPPPSILPTPQPWPTPTGYAAVPAQQSSGTAANSTASASGYRRSLCV